MKNADMPTTAIFNSNGMARRAGDFDDEPRLIGLTKREHFAGLAIQGLIANSYGDSWSDEQRVKQYSKQAVDYADALLAELDKQHA